MVVYFPFCYLICCFLKEKFNFPIYFQAWGEIFQWFSFSLFFIRDAGFLNKNSNKPLPPYGSHFPLREGRNYSPGLGVHSDPLVSHWLWETLVSSNQTAGSSSLGIFIKIWKQNDNEIYKLLTWGNSFFTKIWENERFLPINPSVHRAPCIVKVTFKIHQVGLKFLSGDFCPPIIFLLQSLFQWIFSSFLMRRLYDPCLNFSTFVESCCTRSTKPAGSLTMELTQLPGFHYKRK